MHKDVSWIFGAFARSYLHTTANILHFERNVSQKDNEAIKNRFLCGTTSVPYSID